MDRIELIEAGRERANLSQRKAAALAGMADKWWRDIIRGADAPLDRLALMALAVGVQGKEAADAGDMELAQAIELNRGRYDAAYEMRRRVSELASQAAHELKMSAADVAEAAKVASGPANNFLSGFGWPTEPEVTKLCAALGVNDSKVKNLIWSGSDPDAVTLESLRVRTEPADPASDRLNDLERRIEALTARVDELQWGKGPNVFGLAADTDRSGEGRAIHADLDQAGEEPQDH